MKRVEKKRQRIKTIFGPVTSRRFGTSLGIDLSFDKKRCNFDCLYCELTKAETVTLHDNPVSVESILFELQEVLQKHPCDVITLTANGEPTLYPYLSTLVDEINRIKGEKKLLILSNGSTVSFPSIQEILHKINIVKLSLDAVTPSLFKKLDRPKEVDIDTLVASYIHFSHIYKGELILEILVVKGVNDTKEEFKKLNAVIEKMALSRVDISTVDRPPAYAVNPVDEETLHGLRACLSFPYVTIASRKEREKYVSLNEEEIKAYIKRRPIAYNDLINFDEKTQNSIQKLYTQEELTLHEVGNVRFFTCK